MLTWNHHGAKHSPPGDKFQTSGGPRARGPRPSEMQISDIRLYPNEEFSTATLMIFNVDGAKHSPPGDKFQKSGGPPVGLVGTAFH